jgi:hypothetical protein
MRKILRLAARSLTTLTGICAAVYALYVLAAWCTYGKQYRGLGADRLADEFMPIYEVREEHHIAIRAPAATTMAAAWSISLEDSPIAQAIFKGRELLLHAHRSNAPHPHAFIEWAQSLGWRILAERPGHEIVFGSVTQPWKADVVFIPISPSQFKAFDTAGYVKILFTLRADRVSESASVFHTETRVVSTDVQSREKFRRYWATFSPGILLIRMALLPMVKAAAERAAKGKAGGGTLPDACVPRNATV